MAWPTQWGWWDHLCTHMQWSPSNSPTSLGSMGWAPPREPQDHALYMANICPPQGCTLSHMDWAPLQG